MQGSGFIRKMWNYAWGITDTPELHERDVPQTFTAGDELTLANVAGSQFKSELANGLTATGETPENAELAAQITSDKVPQLLLTYKTGSGEVWTGYKGMCQAFKDACSEIKDIIKSNDANKLNRIKTALIGFISEVKNAAKEKFKKIVEVGGRLKIDAVAAVKVIDGAPAAFAKKLGKLANKASKIMKNKFGKDQKGIQME